MDKSPVQLVDAAVGLDSPVQVVHGAQRPDSEVVDAVLPVLDPRPLALDVRQLLPDPVKLLQEAGLVSGVGFRIVLRHFILRFGVTPEKVDQSIRVNQEHW